MVGLIRDSVRSVIDRLRLVGLAFWTAVLICLALLVFWIGRNDRFPLSLAKTVWAPSVLAILGIRLRVEDRLLEDSPSGCLFVSNHTSLLDIPVLFAALRSPPRFLAKAELQNVPLLGRYIAAMGMVFIDRFDTKEARKSIDAVADLLQRGTDVLAFPEGTRSRDGSVQPFKSGAFVAAIRAGVPVVPVRVIGAPEVLPRDTVFTSGGPVSVRIGEPLSTDSLTLEDRRQLAAGARARIVELAKTGVGNQTGRVASSRTLWRSSGSNGLARKY